MLFFVFFFFLFVFLFFFFFFFFQAEDGIRDLYVTGVQTCALPILDNYIASLHAWKTQLTTESTSAKSSAVQKPRSEEHTSELQSRRDLVCRLLLEKKKKKRLCVQFTKNKKKKKNN